MKDSRNYMVVEVLMTPEDFTALVELARRECRMPGDQLRWLLRRELAKGQSPTADDLSEAVAVLKAALESTTRE